MTTTTTTRPSRAWPALARRLRRRLPAGARAVIWAAPALVLAAVWVYLPLLRTVWLSLLDWNLIGPAGDPVGLDNYRRLVTDPDVRRATANTAGYIVALAPFVVVLPAAAAIAVWKHAGRWTGLYRTLLFAPVLVPPAVGAIMWAWILHPLLGVAAVAGRALGLPTVNWAASGPAAFAVVVLVTGWKVFGLGFILCTAGLTSIDPRLLEAARVAGAREWEVTRHIVLPQLRSTLVFVTLVCVVFAAQWSFTAIEVLTQGGPSGATDNVFHRLYVDAFGRFDIGLASAMAVVVSLAFAGLSALPRTRRRAA